MTALYDAYLATNAPPLPEGYSFKVESELGRSEVGFSLVGPPHGLFRRREKQQIGAPYSPYDYRCTLWRNIGEDTRKEITDPTPSFVAMLIEVYAMWRAVSYEAEISARWSSHDGLHP